ncbi:MAG TPA: helix-turn-helix transcriptional regulator [Mycobacterium sp.]|uniref:helix-turn-helix domain-containing protein n=1 Tax=Mycobacterium sp. TaxID=1785 RepID=UPI002C22A948|nr:helix-turn-helix transcriptional regulator [Mycobacterium sp.]HME78909.1 helix-turn-helix transcriptional regulator [Mycobacterium sp.]
MNKEKLAAAELRNTLKRLRTDRGWSMAEMAELLTAKGLTAYQTTITKIEAGNRAVQIDELVAYADIFECSVDTLLGHTTTAAGDKSVAVSALVNLALAALWGTQDTAARLSRAIANVDGYTLTRHEKNLRTGCVNALDAMDDVITAVDNTTTQNAISFILEQNRPESLK